MSKPHPIALLAGLAFLLVFTNGARAGVTIDVLFHDASVPSGITFSPGDPAAPGCVFSGYYGNSVTTGRCMDVMLYTTEPLLGLGVSVQYDPDSGLALAAMYEWKGVGVSFNKQGTVQKSCLPAGGLADDGGILGSFDCIISPPNDPPVLSAGTYRLGTIVWDLSSMHGDSVISAVLTITDGVGWIPTNITVIPTLVLGSHLLYIPEPGTAALLGLGFVGLVLTARRRRPPTR
ncbi:MAG: PEP-CTERM sorting domain-containing protein [Deltaproteobacteria bacterium]|nr:PEP-CTERM sorting domain-containing protein [Deltaproteobacteria bacterium]